MNGSTWVKSSLGLAVVLSMLGCSGADVGSVDEGEPEAAHLGTARQAIAANGSGGVYSTQCVNAGVPLPPPFGTSTVLTSSYEYGKWTLNPEAGTLISDPIHDHIKVYTTENATPGTEGLCVIGAHYSQAVANGPITPGFFDVICQGKNGNACFWEGLNKMSPDPTATPLYINSLDGGTTLESNGHAKCTSCHAGKNAFIAHYGTFDGLNGVNDQWHMHDWWMPTVDAYTPIVPASWPQNPLGTGSGYPSACTGACHKVGGPAGAFPPLRTPEFAGNGYCQLLNKIVFAPGTAGGMPPGSTCINDNDQNCPAKTDPQIQAMLDACGAPQPLPAVAYKSSPAALSAYGGSSPFAGTWDSVLVGSAIYDVNKTYFADSSYNAGAGTMSSWNVYDFTSALPSSYRSTIWKRDNDGSKMSLAATDYAGQIWQKEYGTGGTGGGTRAVNSGMMAAGSPFGFQRSDGTNVVVFRGTDNYIYQSEWLNSAWTTSKIPNQTLPAVGDPIAYTRFASTSVIYKCGLRICELRQNGTSWAFRVLQSAVLKDGSMPVPFKRANSTENMIFYAATDGLHVITDPTDPAFGDTTDTVVGGSPITSTPAPYDAQDGGVRVAFVSDPGSGASSYLKEAVLPSGSLANSQLSWSVLNRATSHNGETLSADPAAYLSTGVWRNTIVFRNSANTIYQLRTNSSNSGDVPYTLSTIQKGYNINTTSVVAQNQEQAWSMYLPSGQYQFDLAPSVGDSDLYVSQNGPATTTNFGCRPYSSGTTAETCTITVPSPNYGYVYVMVRGYTAGNSSFSLKGYFKD